MKLNCIDAKVFPLPHNITSPQPLADQQSPAQPQPASQPASQLQAKAQPQSTSQLAGSNLMKYNLRPAVRVDTVEHVEQALSVSQVQAELRTGLRRSFTQNRSALDTQQCPAVGSAFVADRDEHVLLSLSCSHNAYVNTALWLSCTWCD